MLLLLQDFLGIYLPVANNNDIDHDDLALFRNEMASVRRLKHDSAEPVRPRPPPIPKKTHSDEKAVVDELLSGVSDWAELETGEELLFVRPGIQKRQLAKLRRGAFSIEAELDLHGFTSEPARLALSQFLKSSLARAHRCVRIVHGKGLGSKHGKPVLKTKVYHWLKQRDEVVAFSSARPNDGGTGAVYVLLKKKR